MDHNLQKAKRGIRQLVSTVRNKFRAVTVRNRGQWDYTRLNDSPTNRPSEGSISKQHVNRMLYGACDKTEREAYQLLLLIREHYQIHLTEPTEDATQTIEQLTRMLDDLELKADELKFTLEMSHMD